MSGGLALGWHSHYEVSILLKNQHFIHAIVSDKRTDPYALTFIYGHPVLAQRKYVWKALENIGRSVTTRWLCISDFNQIITEEDKLSFKDSPLQGNTELLQTFSNLSLLPIDAKGLTFTLMNKRMGENFVMEKLDRAFGNLDWLEAFPHRLVRNLPIIASDHGPIKLDTECIPLFRHWPFRFEWMWTTHSDCLAIVQEA